MAPSRVLISLEDVVLKFGGKPLFDGVRMHICEGDKICLVGRNGAGKTTLMRLIMEDLELDGGKRFAVPGVSIGYLAQTVKFDPNHNVHQFVMDGLKKEDRSEENHHKADRIITPLDLDPAALMKTLSGGQLRRAALASALVAEPDILMLDEPTNHLDLSTIQWLENYLSYYRGALVCVSHDRAFLKAISRKVFWIDRGIIRTCPGGYSEFEDWAEALIEQEAREIQNMQKKFEAEIDWTQGGVSARRKRNQRRLRELGRLREKLKHDKASYRNLKKGIEIDSLTPTQASKIVCEFKAVSKSFVRDGKKIPIIEDMDIRILRGDRIGILGKNGSGKSTFIKLLMGELEPDSGHIRRGKTIEVAYFDQNRVALDPKKSLWDTLCPDGGDQVKIGSGEHERSMHVCGYLKSFLFDPKMARELVGTLSGGQQNRLMLSKVLANPGNVLILDEPTNDLDMDTLDMLQEILSEYPGTLIVVSHDRDFLDRTVTEVLAFEGDAKVESHVGGYSDYVEFKRKSEQQALKKESDAKAKTIAKNHASDMSADAPSLVNIKPAKIVMAYKFRHELEKLPAKIAQLEAEIATLKTALMDADLYTKNPEVFDKSTRRFAGAQQELDAAEQRWIELEDMRVKSES
jgi:ATP-binding cassette subfamily F protein uup